MGLISEKFIQSLQKNKIGVFIMLFAALCTAFGQMFWKLSDGAINVLLMVGFLLYFMGAALMVIAFRFGSLSVLHPLLSIGYVFAVFLGAFFLQEAITMENIIGTVLIVMGTALIGGGDH
ncbi:drug/metabolite transporter (DMT)-like permease [Geomicrobium halophilum]|uniref:Drug/metabolite transporter (DMT)-like permease n=1 Tax=Geomicrobium halophilum TaxID=549000 RepID=A0A841PZL0_9BACL|nr:EamA family transporter [Geomicrobium halophilum]MBB6450433.1 drug/metabolite transporter (DMT)-like permease [Geomicrobium halophilum]